MHTFILGARRFGKTTMAMHMAEGWKELYPYSNVTVLHLNRVLANTYSKRYPDFRHYACEEWLIGHLGYGIVANSLYVVEEVSYLPQHWIDHLGILSFHEAIFTATPKLYNTANVPAWVKKWEKADNQIYLDRPEYLNPDFRDDLHKMLPAHSMVEQHSVLPAYTITDIDLPEELEYLKEDIIKGLNENAPYS